MICAAHPRRYFLEGVPVAPSQDDNRTPSHPRVYPLPAPGIVFLSEARQRQCVLGISVYPLMQLSKETYHLELCWALVPQSEQTIRSHAVPSSASWPRLSQLHFSTCQHLVLCWSWSQCSTLAKPVPFRALISATVIFCLAQAMMSGSLSND